MNSQQSEVHGKLGTRFIPLPSVVVCLLIAACSCAVLWVENGHFTFPVDDPYIHFALAKNIAHGHYGINPGEFSAPSSSLVWPFLLAPFATLPFAVAVPVVFNALCAFATVALFAAMADGLLVIENARKKRVAVLALSFAFALATNQIGLALLGMEHSLQVLCAVWLMTLVVRDAMPELARPSSLAIGCSIALGPLIRYEMVGPSLLAAAYFVYRGRSSAALLGLAVAFGGLGLFSYELVAHGQGALPTSVLAKSGVAPGQPLWVTALSNVRGQLHAGWAVILAFLGFGLFLYLARNELQRHERPLAALLVLTLLGHLLVGRSGWFGRYEAYVLAITYTLGLALFARQISGWAIQRPPTFKLVGLAVFGLVLSARYAAIALSTPLGALNVYQQQAQVARFVHDYYRAPVGVNDLGYVAWRSDQYVLDFIGLASREAFLAQKAHPLDSGAWVGDLTAEHDVRFAAIYDEWFRHLPATWRRCGWLHLGSKRLTTAGDVVAFYALDEATRSSLPPKLHAWATTLPPNVRFEFADGCR